jgi:predicted anti-sigma-YlaC factor YlaD
MGVKCEHIHEALSARLDGEAGELADSVLDAHVAGCADCAAWQQQAMALTARITVPGPTPDLVGPVLSAVRAGEAQRGARRRRATATRIGLALIALVQLALSGPGLILGHDHTAPIHVAHEVGSFDAALALGLLLAALLPRLAAGMLPLVAAITGLLLLTAGSDVAAGRTAALTESPHLLDLAGGLLLLRLAVATSGLAGLRLSMPRSAPTQPAGRG